MTSPQQALSLELTRTGLLTARQVEAWRKRLAAGGFQGRLQEQPSDLPGLWRLLVVEAAWGLPPNDSELLSMGHSSVPLVGGVKEAPLTVSGADLARLTALACRLEKQESER